MLDRPGNDASAPGIAVVEVGDSCRIALALHHMGQERAETEARHAKADEREKVDHRQSPLALLVAARPVLETSHSFCGADPPITRVAADVPLIIS